MPGLVSLISTLQDNCPGAKLLYSNPSHFAVSAIQYIVDFSSEKKQI